MTGAFIGWLIYDSFQEEKEIEYADIDSMIKENESTAFVFPENEDIRPMNIKGYIIDPEKDLTDRIDEVFEKVDTIQPNTVLIKYSNNRLGELIEAAKAEGLTDIPIKVALMGCIVNGPGEAREADIGIAGGKGEALLFKKGEILRKIDENDIVASLINYIKDSYGK